MVKSPDESTAVPIQKNDATDGAAATAQMTTAPTDSVPREMRAGNSVDEKFN